MDTLLAIGLSNAVVATLLAVVAAGVGRLWRRPALTHALWLLVLLKLVTPPIVAVPLHALPEWGPPAVVAEAPMAVLPIQPIAAADPIVPATVIVDEAPVEVPSAPLPETPPVVPLEVAPVPIDVPHIPLASLVALGWLTTSAVWFLVAAWRVERFGRLLRYGTPAPDEVQQEAQELGRRLGLRRVPLVWLVPGTVSPLLWAFRGPARLLLPTALLGRLEAGQRGTLLAHELAHFRRRDHWTRGLEMLATGLFWWHPVTWWARHRLREAEEQCCDAWVVWALPESARSYAHALMNTLDFLANVRPALPPTASAAGHFPLLKRRLAMIVQRTTPRSLSPAGWLAIAALALTALPWSLSRGQTEVEVAPAAEKRTAEADDEARLQAEIAAARAEMAQAQAKAKEAADRLAQLERKLTAQQYTLRLWNVAPVHEMLSLRVDGKEAAQAMAILEAQRAGRKAAVDEADAVLEKAKRRADRLKQLRAGNAVTQEEFDDAISDVKVREAQLRGKQAELQEIEARIAVEKARVGDKVWFELHTPARPVAPALPGSPKAPPGVGEKSPTQEDPNTKAQVARALQWMLAVQKEKLTPDEINKKLDEVIREVEELRKQLKDGRRPGAAAPPPGPGVPEVVVPPAPPSVR